MTIVPGMKRAAVIVGVLGAGLDLSGCTAFQEAVGTVKTPPDEFEVSTRTPLVVPPDLSLRPPQPATAAPKGTNASNQSVDLTAALGSTYSDAEKFLLTRSNALAVDSNRSIVAPMPAQSAQQAPAAAVSPPAPPIAAEPPAVTPNPPQIASLPAPPIPVVVTPSRVIADESDDAPASADAAGPKRPRRTLLRLLFGSDDAAAMQLNEEASASSAATDSTMVEMASLSAPPRRTLFRYLFGSGDTAATQTAAGSGGMPCSTVPVPVAAPSTPAMPAERRTLARLLFAPDAAATMSQVSACAPAATATTENPAATGMPGERRTLLRLFFPPGEASTMQPQQPSAPATVATAPATAMMSTTPAADMPAQRRTLFRMLFPPAEAATMQAPESPAPH
jgi:DUF3035 family protein